MMTVKPIELSTKEYKFLSAGLATWQNIGPKSSLSLYFVKQGYLMTTNGFSLHCMKMDYSDQTEGYYLWSPESASLYKVDSDSIYRPGLSGSAYEVRQKYIEKYANYTATQCLTTINFGFVKGIHLPKVHKSKQGHVGVFRHVMHEGKLHTMCLGIDGAAIEWDADQVNARPADRDRHICIDVNLLTPVLAMLGDNPKMTWQTSKDAVLFGDPDGKFHAFVMPMYWPK